MYTTVLKGVPNACLLDYSYACRTNGQPRLFDYKADVPKRPRSLMVVYSSQKAAPPNDCLWLIWHHRIFVYQYVDDLKIFRTKGIYIYVYIFFFFKGHKNIPQVPAVVE